MYSERGMPGSMWLLKECSFVQADVALNLYDFWVRQPGKKHIKYGLRAYDEVILAPMVRG